jgi:hypothetical protein
MPSLGSLAPTKMFQSSSAMQGYPGPMMPGEPKVEPVSQSNFLAGNAQLSSLPNLDDILINPTDQAPGLAQLVPSEELAQFQTSSLHEANDVPPRS